jgi:hypothetical protein
MTSKMRVRFAPGCSTGMDDSLPLDSVSAGRMPTTEGVGHEEKSADWRNEPAGTDPCKPELQAFVRLLTCPQFVFRLTSNLAQSPLGSSAFAAGQVKRHVTPEGV